MVFLPFILIFLRLWWPKNFSNNKILDLILFMYKTLFFKAQCIYQVKYTDMNTIYMAPLLSKYDQTSK